MPAILSTSLRIIICKTPTVNTQEGLQLRMAVGTGEGGRRCRASIWPGAGRESVKLMGNTPGPGSVLEAVKITNGGTESNSNKRERGLGLGRQL